MRTLHDPAVTARLKTVKEDDEIEGKDDAVLVLFTLRKIQKKFYEFLNNAIRASGEMFHFSAVNKTCS